VVEAVNHPAPGGGLPGSNATTTRYSLCCSSIRSLLPPISISIPSPQHCVASKTGHIYRCSQYSPFRPPPPLLSSLPPTSLLTSLHFTSPPTRLAFLRLDPAHLCVIGSCSQQRTTYHPDNSTLPSKPRRIVQLFTIPLASTVSSSAAPRPHPSELLDRQQSSGVPLEDKADEEQALRLPIPSSHQPLHMISKLPSETVSL
jgi:hypothetical protein